MKTCPQCQHAYADNASYCPSDGAALMLSDRLAAGTVFCRKFRIVDEIGRGGMGVVYQAQHILLKEDRALKLINPHYRRRSEVKILGVSL